MPLGNLFRLAVAALISLAPLIPSCFAQDPQESSSKHPPVEDDGKSKSGASKDPSQPRYDPLRAEKDIEVGTYYMRKGNIDAAIDRFQDAIESHPNYALPFKLLGEAQEKKGLKREAVKSYTRYLEIYPHAEDRDKIIKRIDHLRETLDKKKEKSG
jgi:tetratricopeptide (TPR) repeat protein